MKQDPIDHAILERSSEWLETLKRGDPKDLAEFSQWILESKRHVRHFLMMTALDEELRHIDPERRLQIETRRGEMPDVVPIRPYPDEVPPSRRSRISTPAFRGLAIAASVAVICVLLWAFTSSVAQAVLWRSYETDALQRHSFTLPDGSIARLDVRSRIEAARFQGSTRKIRMVSGQAFFDVKRDASRPFLVQTHRAVIYAVGTQFAVLQEPNESTVTVVDGTVEISRKSVSPRSAEVVKLTKNEQARVDQRGDVGPKQMVADIAKVTAWASLIRNFSGAPASEIVAEANQYNDVQLVLVGQMAAGKLSGDFDMYDAPALSRTIAHQLDADVEEHGNTRIIRAKQSAGSGDVQP